MPVLITEFYKVRTISFYTFCYSNSQLVTKYDLRDSRISCLVNLFQIKEAVPEETTDDWFEHKLNDALKDMSKLVTITDNIYNVITTKYETILSNCRSIDSRS